MRKKVIFTVLLLLFLTLAAYFSFRTPIARSMNKKGITCYGKNDFNGAEKYFRKALHWKKEYPAALINIIKTQLAENRFEEAKSWLSQLIKTAPGSAETFGLEGQVMVTDHNYSEAINMLTRAITADSLLAYAYFYRGVAYAGIDSLEAAASDYLKARQLDKSNLEALEKGAVLFGRLEDFEAAIENYNRIIDLEPSNTEAFLKRGTFRMNISDYINAIEDFTKALNLDPSLAEAYFNRGISYANLGEFEKAKADFDKAAGFNYKTAGASFNSGMACYRLKQYDMAVSYLKKSINLDSENEHSARANYILGAIEMMQNQSAKAIGHFNRSIQIDSTSADAYFNRGIAFGMLKEYVKAIHDLDKCLTLGKKTSDVYFARGVQRISISNFQAGCDDLAKASEMGNQQAADMQNQYCKQYQK
jgi:tetratricopeptide (TPR) repeat protein